MSTRCWLSALVVVGVGAFAAQAQAADTPLALDLHYVAPLSPDSVEGGAGAALRLGRRLHRASWVITAELAGAYDSFGGLSEARLYRAMGGLRFGYGSVLRPGVYVHGGIGRSSFDDLVAPGFGHTAFTYDVGAFLDFTLLPLVNVGAHAAFNQLLKGNNGAIGLDWLNIGLHAELVL